MKEVTDSNFEELVLKSTKPVVLDFWAPWCGPCRMVSPILEELSTQYDPQVEIMSCNVDENPQTAMKFGIRSIPTVLYFRNGQVENLTVGALPKRSFEEKINLLLS